MITSRAPGVYLDQRAIVPPDVEPLRTDIAAFVGIASRGPLATAVRIESWAQFRGTFGSHTPQGHLAYAVEGFFANGGDAAWIVRVADPDRALLATADIPDLAGDVRLKLQATSPGTWGDRIRVHGQLLSEGRFILRVQGSDGEEEVWPNLTLGSVAERLNDVRFGSRLVRCEVVDAPVAGIVPPDAKTPDPRAPRRLSGGADGLASIRPEHLTGLGLDRLLGLRLLEDIREVSIVAIPDIMAKETPDPHLHQPHLPDCSLPDCSDPGDTELEGDPPVAPEMPTTFTDTEVAGLVRSLVGHCSYLRDRFAIVDTPAGRTDPGSLTGMVDDLANPFGAVYYPWLRVADPANTVALDRAVPPSGHIAGVYARTDLAIGVHQPPANAQVIGALDLVAQTDDITHGDLNERGVNVIRALPGRGIRVLGARTTAVDDLDWRFVNVRRLVTMIETAISHQTQWTVFEANDANLWREVDRVIRTLLDDLWRAGKLDGATAAEAYDVTCDETTNPVTETNLGRLTCVVGVRPPWPAEFVILRLRLTGSGVEVLGEAGASDG
jgi:phage tail sheath protein FI